MVEKDSYLMELARYVVLNPVRAATVGDAKEWPWSSHWTMLGRAPKSAWPETDWVLGQFGAHRSDAVRLYEDFVQLEWGSRRFGRG